MTFGLDATSANSGGRHSVSFSASVGLPEKIAGFNTVLVPTMISHAQAYYWSNVWQRDEAESLADLKGGNSVTFQRGEDAVRWLLSADDD